MALAWLGFAFALLGMGHFIIRTALARAERQIAAVDAEARRRMRVAQQRALAAVDPALRPAVEVALRHAEDEALWAQQLILPASPLTLRGLWSSARTVRGIRRLQSVPLLGLPREP